MEIINEEKVNRILSNVGKEVLNEDGTSSTQKLKLNLGSGHHAYPDYINVDLYKEVSEPDVVADITDLSWLPDESVDEIVTYHVIEHLGHRKVADFFRECFRKLKKGGEFIFETPDLGEAIEQFAKIRHNSGEIKGDFGDGSIYETIYGGQKDSGSIHLGCFTKWQLMCMLKWAGWEEPFIIPEIPRRGVEYGIKWNIRMRCVKQ